jgi:heme-degrading monooxygenase HmoA
MHFWQLPLMSLLTNCLAKATSSKRSLGIILNTFIEQGDKNMIKIHIRRIVPQDKHEDLRTLINQLRSVTMGTPGYVAGETLTRVDKPGESLVVTKWQSLFYWNQWFESKERTEIQFRIDQLLGEETRYEIYEYE